MEEIVSGVMMRENKPRRRKVAKLSKPLITERKEKTKALIQEGYSLKKAMELAGYSPKTIQGHLNEYLRKMDIDELRQGLKTKTALSSFKALRVLDELLDATEKDSDKVRAADAILKAGKLHLPKDDTPTSITFVSQTIDKQLLIKCNSDSSIEYETED